MRLELRLDTHELMKRDYTEAIRSLPNGKELTRQDLLTSAFRLYETGKLAIYYAPFDVLNKAARVVILGITPGWTQMEIAYREFRSALGQGSTVIEASQRAKEKASFAGGMRRNLTAILDEIGLPSTLGIKSCEELFNDARHLVHTTSAIRYPVFVNGRNYTGHSPGPLKHPELRRYVEHVLPNELRSVPQALIVPLGKCVASIIEHLIENGEIDPRNCLLGFPHPSGANGHRHREFREGRRLLSKTVEAWFSLLGNAR